MSFQRTASARTDQGAVWIAPPSGQFEKWKVFVVMSSAKDAHLCRVIHVPKSLEEDKGYQEHMAPYTVPQLRQAGATAVVPEDTMRVLSTLETLGAVRRGLNQWREEVASCLSPKERDSYEAMCLQEFSNLRDRFYPTTEVTP